MTFPQPADFPCIPTLFLHASVRRTQLQLLQAISAISINTTLQIIHIPRIHFIFQLHICLDTQVTCCYTLYIQQVATLKQFMLLSIVRQSKEPPTFTQLGNLPGCSRQNIKKLADVLMKKDFVAISPNPCDPRTMGICITQKQKTIFRRKY